MSVCVPNLCKLFWVSEELGIQQEDHASDSLRVALDATGRKECGHLVVGRRAFRHSAFSLLLHVGSSDLLGKLGLDPVFSSGAITSYELVPQQQP